MTWSIVARDATGAFGIAIASRFFAVGVLCPHARSGVGALSTQALVNPLYGRRGLDLLAQGTPPRDAVQALTTEDGGRDHRQVHLIDRHGTTAAYTGAACIGWCGDTSGPNYSVAGNMLAGPEVIERTAQTFETHPGPFAERLLAALDAGDAAGGDKRGRQAAALIVCTTEEYPALDLRVDDAEQPFVELRRLYEKSLERFVPFLGCLPSRARPAGITDRAEIERRIERFAASRKERKAP